MEQQKSSKVIIGIFICLILIAIKPVPSFDSYPNDYVTVENIATEQIVQLSVNRIAIIENNSNSGNYGNITVLEFNEQTKQFEKVSTYNYLPYLE